MPRIPYLPPTPIDEITEDELEEMLDSGHYRLFDEGGITFITSRRKTPAPILRRFLLKGMKAPPMPRLTHAKDSDGKNHAVFAWDYGKITLHDIDEIDDAPFSIKELRNTFAYVVTDRGIHIYQNGKHPLLYGSDRVYERIARENRGWYGDWLRSKDDTKARVFVTTDESAAQAWLLAGGKVRLVKDLVKSYANIIDQSIIRNTKKKKRKR